jgi:hypothetical protein
MSESLFIVRMATDEDVIFAHQICAEMESSAKARGTGIAKRSPDYISRKMLEAKSVIALTHEGHWAGFCYIETWEDGKYVANSGLIVAPQYRKHGLARQIKFKIFELSRTRYPEAKIFGLTTGLAVMKINSELGYEPVTYSELTDDDQFWAGCKSCVNFEILTSKNRKNCLCTGMLYNPKEKENKNSGSVDFEETSRKTVAQKWAMFFKLKKTDTIKKKHPKKENNFIRMSVARLKFTWK